MSAGGPSYASSASSSVTRTCRDRSSACSIRTGACPRLATRLSIFSNAGGGGERVLWAAVECMQRESPRLITVVYTGDVDASKEQILARAQVRQ